jgi:hypothetical protein
MAKAKRGRSTVAIDDHVAGRIRERRIMLGLTQQQLAEMISGDCSTVCARSSLRGEVRSRLAAGGNRLRTIGSAEGARHPRGVDSRSLVFRSAGNQAEAT